LFCLASGACSLPVANFSAIDGSRTSLVEKFIFDQKNRKNVKYVWINPYCLAPAEGFLDELAFALARLVAFVPLG
jgi:hypothetical protein